MGRIEDKENKFMSKTLVIGTIAGVLLVFALGGIFLLLDGGRNQVSPTPRLVNPEQTRLLGLFADERGFLKIDPQTEDIYDDYLQQQPFLPPGVSLDFWESLADAHEKRERFLEVLEDGRIIFIGSPEIPTAPEENTLYVWSIDSNEEPTPLVRIFENRKVQFFTFSPDKKEAAIVAITKTEEQIYEDEGLLNLGKEKRLEEIQKRIVTLQDEQRTILVYDVRSNRLVKTLKVGPEIPSSQERGTADYKIRRLVWNESGLFAIPFFADFAESVLLDPRKDQVLATLKVGYDSRNIQISPDGRYYLGDDLVVRNTLTGTQIARVSLDDFKPRYEIISLGPYAFSPDSKKVTVMVASSPIHEDFSILETDINTNETKRVGGTESLESVWGSQEKIDLLKVRFIFSSMFYDREGGTYLIILGYEDPKSYGYAPQLSLIKLLSKEERSKVFDLPALMEKGPGARIVKFIGWYEERIE